MNDPSSSQWSNDRNKEQLKPPLKKVRSFDTGMNGVFSFFITSIFICIVHFQVLKKKQKKNFNSYFF